MKGRLFWRLYCPYLLVILLCVLGSGAAAFQVIEGVYLRRMAADLEARARLIERQVAEGFSDRRREDLDDLADMLGRAIATRITIIRADGEVLADSEKDPSTMENHRDRPEVQTALAGGVGVKRRHSATLHIDMMYVAVPLREDGRVVAVVRTALPLSEINRALGGIYGR
ncbi:MAG: PAS domain-containing sensor histidine kinase, partial [Anaerolineae bacterium]|nr:PAS domain-containing sensor histidine kinase [Anaerolineae bacterium]